MLRLLQGDVGSGKTAVAAYALAAAAKAGFQGALLAPTDLLARQHRDTVGALLEGVGVDVLLLTGSLNARDRSHRERPIASGQASVVIGTHALLRSPSRSPPRPRDHRRTAPFRRRTAGRARGESRGRRQPARPADDRDAHPQNARAGPVCRPRRLGPAHAARRPGPDPHRHQDARPARSDLEQGPRRGGPGHRTFVVVPLIEEGSEDR